MSRHAFALSSFLALGVAGAFGALCCESDTPETGSQPGLQPNVGFDGGGAGEGGPTGEGGIVDPPGTLNSILGLTSQGSIVRIEIGASGTEVDLGFPTLDGTELRGIRAIAAGPGGLYGLDPGKKSGSSIVKISVPGLACTPLGNDVDFRARIPSKEGLAASGPTIYSSHTQFGPLQQLEPGGELKEYILRQANSAADDTQCSTPEDLIYYGGILAVGSCASATQPEKNGFWVWEYLLGEPGTSGKLTDKTMKFKAPERILGLGSAASGLVAVSAQRNLLVLQGGSFVVARELKATVIDLE